MNPDGHALTMLLFLLCELTQVSLFSTLITFSLSESFGFQGNR